ncbi:MAG TPA: hypothetical protein VFI31_06085 [Pirellulales bacterium]|nr:hypothetical protein [Pirellulales bacterium]
MLVRTLLCVVLLSTSVSLSAEPAGTGVGESSERSQARELLKAKLTEAAKLHAEIDRLRQLAGETSSNIRLRIRLIEVSLTKIANAGAALPGAALLDKSEQDVDSAERQLKLLLQKHIARLRADETLTVAEGASARMHAGDELTSSPGATTKLHGDEITVTAATNAAGRLTIEFDYTQTRPIVRSGQPPEQRVHDIQSTFELEPSTAVVLDGAKEQRVESQVYGVFAGLGRGRVTNTINEIQTFVIVSLADELAAKPVQMR